MPLYEYVCGACGVETEQLRKLSDPPLVDCPACGAAQMTKKVSAVGFRLKGGGWYETDFKKNGQRYIAGDKDDTKKSDGDKAQKDGGGKAQQDGGEGKSKPAGDKSESKPASDKKSTNDKSSTTKKDAPKTANG